MPDTIYIPERSINLKSLYLKVFGSVGVPFPIPRTLNEIKPSTDEFQGTRVSPGTSQRPLRGDFNFSNMLGGEYAMPTALATSPTDFYQLPNEPIISIKGGKKIKRTTIRRGRGSGDVTEESGLKSLEIRIQGICLNEESADYPEDQVTEIRRILETPGIAYVKNYLTGIWGISQITIQDWDIPRRNAQQMNIQPYTIVMRQDLDFDDFKRIIEQDA